MHKLDLGGEWSLTQYGKKEAIKAQVPGCVHIDLLRAGKIDDPYYRDNELATQWVGETGWTYARTFDVPERVATSKRVLLRCEGLDTLATVLVNDKKIAHTENMHRTWEFNIKDIVKTGENKIEIRFDSTLPYLKKRNKQYPLIGWKSNEKVDTGSWIRKEPCNYGWDWGPMLVTCGIWRNISIVAFDTARIADVHIQQKHARDKVVLDVDVVVRKTGRQRLSAAVTISHKGRVVAETEIPLKGGSLKTKLTVQKPKLWWPNGMGEQPLYQVTVDLVDADGALVDMSTKRIGLRTLRLEKKKDRWGESFRFVANGVPFFAKGANWIPADTFATRVTFDQYAYLLGSAVEVNMNMVRVWGGGIYEDDTFYDLCDELGLCVWQDFMFACTTYPGTDAGFRANVKAEAEDNVRRIRHHACLALWCGNNEVEQVVGSFMMLDENADYWPDYIPLFDKLLPAVVKKLDPGRDYIPSSGHSPHGDRADHANPQCGDSHLWAVWHGQQPFEWYRTSEHRFCSEFGFQSFPEPKTVRSFTAKEDRNLTTRVMELHQRSGKGKGNTLIMTYLLDWFRMPTDFNMTLWLTQILQGLGIKYAIEHWRMSMPRTMGALYWQLNDCWPVASWSSIDSTGRWKALHHMAKKFFAPLLISGVENTDKGTVEIHVTSDKLKPISATAAWTLTNVAGKKLNSGSKRIKIGPNRSARVETLKLADYIKEHGVCDLMLWLSLTVGSETVSTNFVSFAKPKHMDLHDPQISTKVKDLKNGSFAVTLRSKKPALWTWLDLGRRDAQRSNNFFHLVPGTPVEVIVTPEREMTKEKFEKALCVKSLKDTY